LNYPLRLPSRERFPKQMLSMCPAVESEIGRALSTKPPPVGGCLPPRYPSCANLASRLRIERESELALAFRTLVSHGGHADELDGEVRAAVVVDVDVSAWCRSPLRIKEEGEPGQSGERPPLEAATARIDPPAYGSRVKWNVLLPSPW
jgi:hypothetical protein